MEIFLDDERCYPPRSVKPVARSVLQGVVKMSWNNHVVQNMRAYFIPYVITIKRIMRVQEKIELSYLSQVTRLSSTKISRNILLATKIKQQQKLQTNSQGRQNAGILLLRDGICHPMPPGASRSRGRGGATPLLLLPLPKPLVNH